MRLIARISGGARSFTMDDDGLLRCANEWQVLAENKRIFKGNLIATFTVAIVDVSFYFICSSNNVITWRVSPNNL